MKNDVYGKTLKNVRSRIDVKFVSNEKRIFKMGIKIKLHATNNI